MEELRNLSSMVKKFGWDKPYMVTEWGPYGHWESPMTSWGVAIEATSKEKAMFRNLAYQAIEKDSALCLGSYAFFMGGYKQGANTNMVWNIYKRRRCYTKCRCFK